MPKDKVTSKDPQVVAAQEIYEAARGDAKSQLTAKDMEISRLKNEIDTRIEQAEAKGVLKKIANDRHYNDLIEAVVLYRVKEAKAYKAGGLTWKEFCDGVGIDQKQADRIINDIRPIYESFSGNLSNFSGIPINKIRYLGKAVSSESDNLSETIPDTPEEIEAFVDDLKSQIKAKDTVLKDKETALQKAHKREDKLEADLEKANRAASGKLYGDIEIAQTPEDQHAMEQCHFAHDQVVLALTALRSIDREKTSSQVLIIARDLCLHLRQLAIEVYAEMAEARPEIPEAAETFFWEEKLPFGVNLTGHEAAAQAAKQSSSKPEAL